MPPFARAARTADGRAAEARLPADEIRQAPAALT
jgi:hypothetical protein